MLEKLAHKAQMRLDPKYRKYQRNRNRFLKKRADLMRRCQAGEFSVEEYERRKKELIKELL